MPVNSETGASRNAGTTGSTATTYAQGLLKSLGVQAADDRCANLCMGDSPPENRSAEFLWADSGAMWLTGHSNAPPRMCTAPLAACAQGAWLALAALAPGSLDAGFKAYRLLGERAAIMGLQRRGRTSAGGACQLYDTADGVLALNLTRDSDYELLPAWLQESALPEPGENINFLVERLKAYRTNYLVGRARLLGLAAAAVSPPALFEVGSSRTEAPLFREQRFASPRQPTLFNANDKPLVIDLTALWAGPLCAQLLGSCGARVIKVESLSRPDGARMGEEDFFNLLNGEKESVSLDLGTDVGIRQLHGLLEKADIVIESSRPRALEQMGIYARNIVAQKPGMVWLSITGYGRSEPMRDWIAYGDDAGVAAGLSWLVGGGDAAQGGDPVFCGDAIADPLTGLHAAVIALARWRAGGGVLLDVALCDVVAHCISSGEVDSLSGCVGPDFTGQVTEPVARPVRQKAVAMGGDTLRVLQEFGLEFTCRK